MGPPACSYPMCPQCDQQCMHLKCLCGLCVVSSRPSTAVLHWSPSALCSSCLGAQLATDGTGLTRCHPQGFILLGGHVPCSVQTSGRGNSWASVLEGQVGTRQEEPQDSEPVEFSAKSPRGLSWHGHSRLVDHRAWGEGTELAGPDGWYAVPALDSHSASLQGLAWLA